MSRRRRAADRAAAGFDARCHICRAPRRWGGRRHCSGCCFDLPYSEFWTRRDARDGVQRRCKICQTGERRRYYRPVWLVEDAFGGFG